MSDKLQKLINHERSARKIGNVAEADAYARKIAELKRSQPKPQPVKRIKGTWKCTCGEFELTLDIDGNAWGQQLFDSMSANHNGNGHSLIEVK